MNSEESHNHEQKPPIEAPGNQPQDLPPVAISYPGLEEENTTDELPVEDQEKPPEDLPPIAIAYHGLKNLSTIDELPPKIAGLGREESEIVETEVTGLEKLSIRTEPAAPLEDNQELNRLGQTIAQLQDQEQELRQKISDLQESQSQILSIQLAETQTAIAKMVQEGVKELEQRKQELLIAVEQLERRRERIRTEMRTTFAGVSQELAIRVQGFKDYLVGSLQDLAASAEQLELATPNEPVKPVAEKKQPSDPNIAPKFTEQKFQEQVRQIRSILDQYRKMPDYYGPPWQLRRTFEPIHAERVGNWFFDRGGRGALRTMGSRLQNILVASATVSVLRTLYGDKLRTLILANTPERLGEWRRGLQDCLGISRSDFGPEQGVSLFEESPLLVQKADRLVNQKQLPFIIIDETEDKISLSLLQFPLWLAFAPDPQQQSSYDY
ncbi:MAG TPA: DUF3086 domain-containing protein [Cyanobacteria bacterium UBA11149]|nr:DUF3086 domain-containing protein [Cyanobacteria bacterium UBA11367]HBE56000.1 DUF3086 domain-containing protein [Cyanobacteria bacterium UBA11366]HBK66124.1 DUF3086 domain-containing protein [Cyanobacteria bacterium UBA11166]HBR74060.1 DUF3086 domain-containing protein [Cyanobacteria bacterium UBA11159]HBS68378.1 DUF3086 domain-containing protein [Cyanobacteria bacterium UBA11153]HBW89979.1 DUF3086 domain-containing protein [Cyanobacteria bacterium UBA11149]HCA94142.1 DUF3086 domain-conta